jgi:dienelactone hydrolase
MIDGQRNTGIGYCFGGSTALQLAYAGEKLAGVVSFHGALTPDSDQGKAIKPKILVCHGAADSFIPEKQVQEFRQGLESAGTDWQMIYYAGARHSFTNPYADKAGVEGIKYDKQADTRSWAHMRQFSMRFSAAAGEVSVTWMPHRSRSLWW